MPKHVVVLGAGFGGLELVTGLSESVPDKVQITLIDKSDSFMFGFSKLDVIFGRRQLPRCGTPIVTLPNLALSSAMRTLPRLILSVAESSLTQRPTTPTSSWLRSVLTTTWRQRRGWPRMATSSTPLRAPSEPVTRWPVSAAAMSSSGARSDVQMPRGAKRDRPAPSRLSRPAGLA